MCFQSVPLIFLSSVCSTGSSWSCRGVLEFSSPKWRRLPWWHRRLIWCPLKRNLRPSQIDWVKMGLTGTSIPPLREEQEATAATCEMYGRCSVVTHVCKIDVEIKKNMFVHKVRKKKFKYWLVEIQTRFNEYLEYEVMKFIYFKDKAEKHSAMHEIT